MSRLDTVVARYAHAADLIRNGVELDLVEDPPGARVNAAVRQLLVLAREDISGLWDGVLGAAKSLRWRLLTQPQPVQFNPAVLQAVRDVVAEAAHLRRGVGSVAQRALDELIAAAEAVPGSDPITGVVLLESIREATAATCVVFAASGPAAVGVESWLGHMGFRVTSVSQLIREQSFAENGYAVGPPRFFPASLVTAPMTGALNFVFPVWFGERSVPRSALAVRAEGAILITSKDFTIGQVTEPVARQSEDAVDEAELLPQASWIPPDAASREPGAEEVAARRVLLSGGYSMWLDDDGEWIRAVDPSQPGGGRVTNVDVVAVRSGIYLLLRDGETERHALYQAALKLMGPQAKAVETSQAEWKGALQERLDQLGRARVVRELAEAGVKTLDRVAAWTEPMLARPRSNQDFEKLLQWLGVRVHPAYELATALRRMRAQASANIAEQLEEAVAAADMTVLERDGHLRLELKAEGFRGVIATRVLSISPHVEVISRHDARELRPDRSAKWLE
jgi:hypothetical protein